MSGLESTANVFGRGTAAGDAIYRCYARPHKVSTLDPALLARLKKLRMEREAAEANVFRPKPIPKSKAMINCPRVCGGQRLDENEIAKRRLEALPRKKPEAVILQEMRLRSPPKPPQFERKPITVAEKERLERIFQFGELPSKPLRFTGANRIRFAAIDRRCQLKERFNDLSKQVHSFREELRQLKDEQGAVLSGSTGNKDEKATIIPIKYNPSESFRIRNPTKALEKRILQQTLTQSIADLLFEMKAIDDEISQLNEEEAKKYEADT